MSECVTTIEASVAKLYQASAEYLGIVDEADSIWPRVQRLRHRESVQLKYDLLEFEWRRGRRGFEDDEPLPPRVAEKLKKEAEAEVRDWGRGSLPFGRDDIALAHTIKGCCEMAGAPTIAAPIEWGRIFGCLATEKKFLDELRTEIEESTPA